MARYLYFCRETRRTVITRKRTMQTLRINQTRHFKVARQENRHFEIQAIQYEGMSVATEFVVRTFINDETTDISLPFGNVRDALTYFDMLVEIANGHEDSYMRPVLTIGAAL